MSKLDFPTGLGLYVTLPHPKMRLQMVKPLHKILIFLIPVRRRKIMHGLKSFREIADLRNLQIEWNNQCFICQSFFFNDRCIISFEPFVSMLIPFKWLTLQGAKVIYLLLGEKMMLKNKQYFHKKQGFSEDQMTIYFSVILNQIALEHYLML